MCFLVVSGRIESLRKSRLEAARSPASDDNDDEDNDDEEDEEDDEEEDDEDVASHIMLMSLRARVAERGQRVLKGHHLLDQLTTTSEPVSSNIPVDIFLLSEYHLRVGRQRSRSPRPPPPRDDDDDDDDDDEEDDEGQQQRRRGRRQRQRQRLRMTRRYRRDASASAASAAVVTTSRREEKKFCTCRQLARPQRRERTEADSGDDDDDDDANSKRFVLMANMLVTRNLVLLADEDPMRKQQHNKSHRNRNRNRPETTKLVYLTRAVERRRAQPVLAFLERDAPDQDTLARRIDDMCEDISAALRRIVRRSSQRRRRT